MKLQHYNQKQPNHAHLSLWLVALCPGLNAVDIEGWLFMLITPPFAALLKVFKDYKYPPEIDTCPAEISDKQSM